MNETVNQQETDIGWLCGMIDADGSFGLRLGYKKVRTPFLTITNTRSDIIEFSADVINRLNVGRHIYWWDNDPSHKIKGEVQVSGMKRVQSLLSSLPLIAKSEKAEILKDYVQYRMSLPNNYPYTSVDDDYANDLRKPNQAPQRLHAVLSEKSDAFLVGWLAGIIDGDGAVMIRRGTLQKDGRNRLNIDTVVINSDAALIEAAHYVYKKLGGDGTIVKKDNGPKATKPIYHLQSAGYKRTVPILSEIVNHLHGKKSQAQLCLDLYHYRESVPYRSCYGEYEYSLYEKVKKLNFRGRR